MNQKLNSYIGFAIKSRAIVYGVDNIIEQRSLPVVLADPTLSQNSQDRLYAHLNGRQVRYIILDLKEYLPKKNCKAVAIKDIHLAEAIIKQWKESQDR